MKKNAVFLFTALFLTLFIFSISGIAVASTLLFDRGLPTANINNAAGANRSNVTWASTKDTGFTGDDFIIGSLNQSYVIDSITVWGAQVNPLSDDIANIWLYLGKAGESLALLSTGAVTGNNNANPDISHKFITYSDPANTSYYEGSSTAQYGICETTFSNLNYIVEGGVKYDFGVDGDNYLWWNHASNARLSGSYQEGADGYYLEFDTADLSSVSKIDSLNNSWDKSSDINVKIYGSPVPEPSTMLLLGFGLVGFAGVVRKKMKK